MEKIESIESLLNQESIQNIEKKKQSKVLPLIVIIISILMAIIPICGLSQGKYTNMGIYMVAITMLIIGIVLFVIASHGFSYYYTPTGNKLKHHKVFIGNTDIATIKPSILSNREPDFTKIEDKLSSGHYLDIMGTDDGKFYLIQLIEYIPYDYRATTPVFTCEGNCANGLHDLIRK